MLMMVSGLLWYDDDTHHPLAQKVAEAAQRYRERVGYEPTTCQLNPALIPGSTQSKPQRAARKSGAAAVIPLRLEPNEHLRPNYFYVGVLAGERLKRAVDQRAAHHRRAVARADVTPRKPEKRGKARS
jgi:hypothetical protein